MHRPDPHLLAVIAAQGRTDAASPSGVARQQAQAATEARWADLAPGQPCRLTTEALDRARGTRRVESDWGPDRWEKAPALPADSDCRIWTIDASRNLAQVVVRIEHPTFPATLAIEVSRAEILPVPD